MNFFGGDIYVHSDGMDKGCTFNFGFVVESFSNDMLEDDRDLSLYKVSSKENLSSKKLLENQIKQQR